ncbi:GntR family transcriptional regulator [Pontibacter sp. G13]|uniref:GntR family transcriptional regulator n=1 Tax=Pontibacter sp. G13 TaxID=3074898 RepID=UPI002888FC68|nr:GntR family transcriptional regulator [Pontibacter sp. G13]WNJ17862.1 GntR family transcriptional regulator [Pontibacter sp. G13]
MEHVELVDRIYLKIRQMIFNQELKPGQKLVQEKLAAQLGISRSPLLKALQKLESEMLVESIPRRGMYVKQMDPAEIQDIFQCRAVIEGLSARLCAERLTPDQIQTLKDCFAGFDGDGPIDPKTYAESDRAFHTHLMQWSGNAVVLRLEILSHIHLSAYQVGLLRTPSETLGEHLAIIDALEAGNGTLAEQLMRTHIEDSLAAFLARS